MPNNFKIIDGSKEEVQLQLDNISTDNYIRIISTNVVNTTITMLLYVRPIETT